MKFPKVIRHRKAEVTIYGKRESYPFYRIAYRINGQRRMKSFATYGEAKADAEKKARELSQGSQSLALTTKDVTAALSMRDALDVYHRETGRTVTALQRSLVTSMPSSCCPRVTISGKPSGAILGPWR